MKKIGIIGGLGPETSCKLCLDLNIESRNRINQQPDLIMSNIAMTKKTEKNVVRGNVDNKLRKQLKDSVKDLNNAGADLLVIPCNSVHVHIDELRKTSDIPILSIIEECAEVCKKRNLKKIGILGTDITIKQALHQNQLKNKNIETVIPEKHSQDIVSETILKILSNKTTEKDKQKLLGVIEELKNKGADGVILGCTDLDLLISQSDTDVKLIDSVEVLKNKILEIIS